ncbi:MAG: hypothetical protein A2579_13525 [Lysobacterales bacterium RIFOXYD1_FULL_69_11]|nr:MAG: hypothetical protein A2190_08180 [Xanthomonadales bacterium RIFOXYA1_FULL_69_10]OHE86081.1 MAG: hypothetical protein A2579_13525 [Xanthomonadales bacterium RIFOXYD1_FULL_69_11]
MTPFSTRRFSALSAAIVGVLLLSSGGHALAQSERARDRQEQAAEATSDADRYANATRKAPKGQAGRAGRKMERMIDLYDDAKNAEALAIADEIIAAESSNAYEKAFSSQFAAQLAFESDDTAAAMRYLVQALEFDGLDNPSHYGVMWMLAQLQLQEEQNEAALATVDRLISESNANDPQHLLLKGQVLNRMERYPEAVAVLEQLSANPGTARNWQSELMFAYSETDQGQKVAALAERMAADAPDDKRAQMNLAAAYQQADMLEKSAEVLERLRSSGQLTEDREYRQLYSTYLNLEGKESVAAAVIDEGLAKGVIKADFQAYQALAQAHYFSDNIPAAIEAYKKAAPLDDNGDTYLNLAKVLWQEDRIAEAREAARQAKSKGLDRPKEADQIIALQGN